jgi:hypothetical protein
MMSTSEEQTLDEQALRKPGFVAGCPVTLADSQVWYLPPPRLRFKPKFVDGTVTVAIAGAFGPGSEDDTAVLFGNVEADGAEFMRAKFAMAVRMLGENYSLRDEDFSRLIVLEVGDPASVERWKALGEAMRGETPKPAPAI